MEPHAADRYTATFPARRDAWADLCAFVEDACARAQVGRDDALRVVLLVEELFVNTVEHGHGEDSDAPVDVALAITPAAIAVEYRDTARAHDPFASSGDDGGAGADPGDVDARRVGGLGIRLITAIAEQLSYARRDECNCISFHVARAR